MRVYGFLVCVAVAAVACGGDDGDGGGGGGPVAPFESGSRLRAVYLDGGDGATLLQHWHDSELDVDCRLRSDASGQLRCFPTAGVNLVYLEPGCTGPALEQSAGQCSSDPTGMVTETRSEDCGERVARAYSVGSEVSRDTSYYLDFAGDCVQVDHGVLRPFLQLSPLDPAMFASATLSRRELDSGLGVDVAELEGGGHQVWRAVSLAHDKPCVPGPLGDPDVEYCRYGTLGYDYGNLHSDPACTAADLAYTRACEPPDFIIQTRDTIVGQCVTAEFAGLFTAGDPVALGDVYQGGDQSCGPPLDLGWSYYMLGPPAENDMPEVSRLWVGDGRLQVEHHATPQNTPLVPRATIRDTQAGADCSIIETASGLRCVTDDYTQPSSNILTFSDDQCTEQLIRVGIPICGGEPVVPDLFLLREVGVCGPGDLQGAYEVGPVYTGPLFQGDKGGTNCTAIPAPDNAQFHTIGAEVSLIDYPEIQLVTE